jgi:hypothetical protein
MIPKEFLATVNAMPVEEDLKVDKLNLDVHLEQLASVFKKYCKKITEAMLYREDCKIELDFAVSDLGKQIRSNSKAFGIDKVTEAAIAEVVNTTKEIIELQNELMEWNSIEKELSFIREALIQKKDSIMKLVQLYSDDYFNTTNITSLSENAAPKVSLRRTAETENKIGSKLNRKREE